MLPTVIVSSVIRSTHQGESHGGVYLVDLEAGDVTQVIDWDHSGISWEGRGADRGLRGIAFHGDHVLLAASDEVFIFDRSFERVDSLRNRYLRHCHEISLHEGRLLLTSTGYDSILEVDVATGAFVAGYHLHHGAVGQAARRLQRFGANPVPRVRAYDPMVDGGPDAADTLHINNVHADDTGWYASGTEFGHLVRFTADHADSYATIPHKTHNSRPFREGVIANHTSSNAVAVLDRRGGVVTSFAIPRYDPADLTNSDVPADHARQAFGRGLTVHDDRYLIGGSSPATIAVHDLGTGETIKAINLTMDVRNAVHGLEVWE